jgi:hypothetical protein
MAFCGCLDEILRSCEPSVGGLNKIWAIPYDSVDTVTITDGEVTAFTLVGTASSFYCEPVEIQVNKDSSSYVEEGNIDLVNGTTLFTTTLTAMIGRRDVAKRNAIMLMAAGQQDLMVILKDNNGIYWLMGDENGANLTNVGEGSGQAKADNSKYSLTFTAEQKEMMPALEDTVVAALGL